MYSSVEDKNKLCAPNPCTSIIYYAIIIVKIAKAIELKGQN